VRARRLVSAATTPRGNGTIGKKNTDMSLLLSAYLFEPITDMPCFPAAKVKAPGAQMEMHCQVGKNG
jgi:hypothetical protein